MKIDFDSLKRSVKRKLFKIFKKGKANILLKVEIMTKQSAIRYLKLLHDLEQKYNDNLFTTDLKKLAEHLRFEFIKNYQNKGA